MPRDDEQPTSPLSPLASFPPLEDPDDYESPGVGSAPEFYGFVAWMTTSLAWILYILWALLPDEWIVATGVEWYPNREWAILLPAWSIVLVLLTYFTYFGLAIAGTPAFHELRAFTDSHAHIPSTSATNRYLAHAKPNSVPEIYDIPIGLVNRVKHGVRKRPGTM